MWVTRQTIGSSNSAECATHATPGAPGNKQQQRSRGANGNLSGIRG